MLPETYQEVEYIENTSTQYIDTGVYAGENTRITLEAMSTDTAINSVYAQLTGGISAYRSTSAIQVAYRLSTSTIHIDWGTGGMDKSPGVGRNTKFTVNLENNNILVNGTKITQLGELTATSPKSLWIFHANNVTSSNAKSFIGRLYSYKVYDGDTLIRDFIPCYRKSDTAIGLYDLVNDVFYTNAGTGTFGKGNDVPPARIYLGDTLIHTMLEPSVEVPIEYQQVEYVGTTRTQFIDADIHPKTTSSAMIDFQVDTLSGSISIFGFAGARSTTAFFLTGTSNGFRIGCSSNFNTVETDFVDTNRHVALIEQGSQKLDGVQYGTLSMTSSAASNQTVYLGNVRYGYSPGMGAGFNGKIYSCKLWESGVLVRNFVPCYRLSDGVIGLYDTVNKLFYTNSGTGTFLKGDDVGKAILTCKDEVSPDDITIKKDHAHTARVEYNSSTIASMTTDSEAVLKCDDKLMADNVTVTVA